MFLKINNDLWHGILAFIIPALLFLVFWEMSAIVGYFHPGGGAQYILEMAKFKFPGLYFLASWAAGALLAHYLQCWNEIKQALDPNLEAKYGTWDLFVLNSKRDFKYFWRGLLASWILPFIYVVI